MSLRRRLGGRGFAAAGETLALLFLAPLAVSFKPHMPAWDELYFFHRAACIRNAVQALSWPMADNCLDNMTKSPILATMLLPSPPLHGTENLALAAIMLSLLCFGLLWLAIRMAQRGGIPLGIVAAGCGVAILAPPLWAGAPFLGDELAAIVVLDTLLLLLLESAVRTTAWWDAFKRGLLWGVLFSIGVLTKLTYMYFAGLVFAALVVLSIFLCGAQTTAVKLAAMGLVCLLPAAVFARYGWIYWDWAMNAAFGRLATFYNDHLQRWPFLAMTFGALGLPYWVGMAALFGISLIIWRTSRQRRAILTCAGLLGIVGGYVFIASGSPNKDPRFFWPVWLSLPFCVAALAARVPAAAPVPASGAGLMPIWLGLALSIVTSGRFDFGPVAQADLILRSIPHGRPTTVLLASDEARFNVEDFILARQLDLPALRNIDVTTVVYDVVNGFTPAQSIKRLTSADYVVFRMPVDGSAPEWANQFLPRFAAAVEAKGRLVWSFPDNIRLYAMH